MQILTAMSLMSCDWVVDCMHGARWVQVGDKRLACVLATVDAQDDTTCRRSGLRRLRIHTLVKASKDVVKTWGQVWPPEAQLHCDYLRRPMDAFSLKAKKLAHCLEHTNLHSAAVQQGQRNFDWSWRCSGIDDWNKLYLDAIWRAQKFVP